MKSFLKFSRSTALTIMSVLAFSACNDWTDPESLQLLSPSFEEQNPQLYEDYIKDLNNYKLGKHKILFVSFNNPLGSPIKQAERLTVIPDSVDFIVLNNPNIDPVTQQEMIKIREKGIRTTYNINYSNFEADWKIMQKANPELTEAEALEYLGKRTDEMLSLCDKYNYDGIVIDYTGRSLVSLLPATLNEYTTRQISFFNKVMEWRNKHTDKALIFYGNVQYLVPESLRMLSDYSYIIPKTATSTNAEDLSVKIYLAIEAGVDAISSEEDNAVNPVPSDRFMACAELPQANDKNKVKGYWNTVDTNGNKTPAALGVALWVQQYSPDYARSGVYILNIHNDYYNNTYGYVREVIRIMNPNK